MVVVRWHREKKLLYEGRQVFGLFYRGHDNQFHIDVEYSSSILQRIDNLLHEGLHLLVVYIVRCNEGPHYNYHNYPCVVLNLLMDYLSYIRDLRWFPNPSELTNALREVKYVRSPDKRYKYLIYSTS